MRKIPLSGKNGKGMFALVDDEDFERLNRWKWAYQRGYAVHRSPRKNGKGQGAIYMHRLIMDTPSGKEVDHRDLNRLNNQRINLRNCTYAQNKFNRNRQSNNTTGYKGVCVGYKKKLRAMISIKGILTDLGTFSNPISAAKVYDEAAKKYHGEFARLNFPER